MADRRPETDRPIGLSGASDLWDVPQAGVILTAEYFATAPSPPSGGLLKYWSGSAWIAKPLKAWSGSAWVQGALRFWNGSAWQASA